MRESRAGIGRMSLARPGAAPTHRRPRRPQCETALGIQLRACSILRCCTLVEGKPHLRGGSPRFLRRLAGAIFLSGSRPIVCELRIWTSGFQALGGAGGHRWWQRDFRGGGGQTYCPAAPAKGRLSHLLAACKRACLHVSMCVREVMGGGGDLGIVAASVAHPVKGSGRRLGMPVIMCSTGSLSADVRRRALSPNKQLRWSFHGFLDAMAHQCFRAFGRMGVGTVCRRCDACVLAA